MISDVFERLDEIASALPPERWMLVGGLMVHAHALPATARRVTCRIASSLGSTRRQTRVMALFSISRALMCDG